MISFPGLLYRDAILVGTPVSAAWGVMSFYIIFGIFGLAAVVVECFHAGIVESKRKAGRIIFTALILMLTLISGMYVVTLGFDQLLPPLSMPFPGLNFLSLRMVFRIFGICSMLATLGLGVTMAARRSRVVLW